MDPSCELMGDQEGKYHDGMNCCVKQSVSINTVNLRVSNNLWTIELGLQFASPTSTEKERPQLVANCCYFN